MTRISSGGGGRVRWSSDGKELFYEGQGGLWVVEVELDQEIRPGIPEQLFAWRGGGAQTFWDVMPGGESFVIIRGGPPRPPVTRLNVVRNFVSTLEELMAGGR